MSGKIHKSKSTGNFTIIPNAVLEDQRLSLKAIGLLCYLLRLPHDWVIYKTYLHKKLKDGRDSVSSAFQELEDIGYITKEQVRGEGGTFMGYDYEVKDTPEIPFTGNPYSGDQFTGNQPPDNPEPENPELLSTNNTNTLSSSIIPKVIIEGPPLSDAANPAKQLIGFRCKHSFVEPPPFRAAPPKERETGKKRRSGPGTARSITGGRTGQGRA